MEGSSITSTVESVILVVLVGDTRLRSRHHWISIRWDTRKRYPLKPGCFSSRYIGQDWRFRRRLLKKGLAVSSKTVSGTNPVNQAFIDFNAGLPSPPMIRGAPEQPSLKPPHETPQLQKSWPKCQSPAHDRSTQKIFLCGHHFFLKNPSSEQ